MRIPGADRLKGRRNGPPGRRGPAGIKNPGTQGSQPHAGSGSFPLQHRSPGGNSPDGPAWVPRPPCSQGAGRTSFWGISSCGEQAFGGSAMGSSHCPQGEMSQGGEAEKSRVQGHCSRQPESHCHSGWTQIPGGLLLKGTAEGPPCSGSGAGFGVGSSGCMRLSPR